MLLWGSVDGRFRLVVAIWAIDQWVHLISVVTHLLKHFMTADGRCLILEEIVLKMIRQ